MHKLIALVVLLALLPVSAGCGGKKAITPSAPVEAPKDGGLGIGGPSFPKPPEK